MLVEGDVEIRSNDRSTAMMDDHDLKLWIQRSFKQMACYRISNFRKEAGGAMRAAVALKISDLPAAERQLIETHPHDVGPLRSFMERMFAGKGTCRCIGDPALKDS